MHVVATAGHVDHGKSTLVKALTGIDPDRFAEEKERGLTIDLGFASTDLPSGRGMAIVDVPGHVRFLKNMLAGVGAVDACMFIVSATEGWKPQSEEHLRILELLDIGHGIVVLTKIGLVDDELRALAELDVEEHVAGTFLEEQPIVGVDALDDIGLDDLRAALDTMLADTPTAVDHDRPRLWIDRAFAATGAGTVVTGTLTGGRLRVDEEVSIQPGDRRARIRGLQSLHRTIDQAAPGSRVAVNLAGIGHDEVRRGDAIVRPNQWHLTTTLDASLAVLGTVDHTVSRRGAHVVYLGSGEHPARLRVLGPDAIEPGDEGNVRLFLAEDLPLLPGDRFVLRESGRMETIGGGEVLDLDPRLRASDAVPDRSIDRVIAERGWVRVDELLRLTGETRQPSVGDWIVDDAVLAEDLELLRVAITDAGPLGIDLAALDERQRALLDLLDEVSVDGAHARIGGAVDLADHPFIAELEAEPFRPPAPDGRIDRGELRELVRQGLVIEEDKIFFAATAVEAAAKRIAAMLATDPEGVTVAEIREELDTTRKYALPLLAHLDSTGRTRRRDDVRIAGPRLPDP